VNCCYWNNDCKLHCGELVRASEWGRSAKCWNRHLSRTDPSPVFQAAEGALNDVAQAIGTAVEGMLPLPRGTVGNDRPGAALDQHTAQGVTVIGGIGQTQSRYEITNELGGDGASPRWPERTINRRGRPCSSTVV